MSHLSSVYKHLKCPGECISFIFSPPTLNMSFSLAALLALVCVGTCVQASGLFGHHGGWHHPDHSEHGDNHHGSEWGSKHGDAHGWGHGNISH